MCHAEKINFLSQVGSVAICRDREGTARVSVCSGGRCRDSEKALKMVLSCGGLWERKLSQETSLGTIERPPEAGAGVTPNPQPRGCCAFLPNRDECCRAVGWRGWAELGLCVQSCLSPQLQKGLRFLREEPAARMKLRDWRKTAVQGLRVFRRWDRMH